MTHTESNTDRQTATPDSALHRISPEVFNLAQFSPTDLYGKEDGIESHNWMTQPYPASIQSRSTLNTPDPIFYEDTDSNDSAWQAVSMFCQDLHENPLQDSGCQSLVEEIQEDDLYPRGVKRAFDQVLDDNCFGNGYSKYAPATAITNYINQGRPPDISTWTAVNPSTQQMPNGQFSDHTGPWNKPTCAVPPYHPTSSFSVPPNSFNNPYWNLNHSSVSYENNQLHATTAFDLYNSSDLNVKQQVLKYDRKPAEQICNRPNINIVECARKRSDENTRSNEVNQNGHDEIVIDDNGNNVQMEAQTDDRPNVNVGKDETQENCTPSREGSSSQTGLVCKAHSTTIDLTNVSESNDNANKASTKQCHNLDVSWVKRMKPFTEIYLKKGQRTSTSNINTALDLRKRVCKKREIHRRKHLQAVAKKPEIGELVSEPRVPESYALNNLPGPTLAYNGATLVPYMNSIFSAMANFKKSQTIEPNGNTTILQKSSVNSPVCSTIQKPSIATSTVASIGPTIQTGSSQVSDPRINVSSLPLPLYAAPLQCPIRPLVPVVKYGLTTQRMLNPFLCRYAA